MKEISDGVVFDLLEKLQYVREGIDVLVYSASRFSFRSAMSWGYLGVVRLKEDGKQK